jgi:hypothetical protein
MDLHPTYSHLNNINIIFLLKLGMFYKIMYSGFMQPTVLHLNFITKDCPYSIFLIRKLVDLQPLNKYPHFKVWECSYPYVWESATSLYPGPDGSNPLASNILQIHFSISLQSLAMSPARSLSLQTSLRKPCMPLSFHFRIPHTKPSTCSLIRTLINAW